MIKRKVILLFPNFSNGGAEKAFISYRDALSERYDVILLNLKAPAAKGIYRKHKVFKNYILVLLKCLYLICCNRKVELIIISFKGHVFYMPILAVIRYIGGLEFKIIFRESNDVMGYARNEIKSTSRYLLFKYILKKFPAACADVVICNSRRSQEGFTALITTPDDKVVTLYNPQNISRQTKPSIFKYHIAFVGRFEQQKDPLRFIDIVTMLPIEMRAVMVGNGSLLSKIKQRIDKSNLTERIKVVPYSPENVSQALSSSSIFVLTSKYEGMPNVVFEALSNGAQVLASKDASGPTEILPDRFLIKANQNSEFAEKIIASLNHSLEDLTSEERKKISYKFSRQSFVLGFDKMIKVL